MPFGAQFREGRGIRFALWAPKVSRVDLVLEKNGRKFLTPMDALENGWFGLETESAGPGDLYRYRVDQRLEVPDPASRYNPFDVHGPSQIIDPGRFEWDDLEWRGRPWAEAVIYELHVGAFTPEGNFKGVEKRLDHLAGLGITAIELMPVADFPGLRNWGYDGVLPYAPDSSYGHPDDLKELIQACHHKGMMVLLDVVYNHFGPEGNYLHSYAPDFFTDRHKTPWGNAINFDGSGSRIVRDFFIHNALYWLEEFYFDGLRLDAVHSIFDKSEPHILYELAEAVRKGPGRERFCHLVLENWKNNAHYLGHDKHGTPSDYNAQWNDDWHHAAHVLTTGERDGYYSDFADKPVWYLGRCLAQGFAFQGEISEYHDGIRRGEPSSALPLTAFVPFLQNHDQIGNRAFGERISQLVGPEPLAAVSAILLLAPSPPMLFMGEEFACEQPFLYFCDFEPELARAVSLGRRQEFAGFFSGLDIQADFPDPDDPASYQKSKIDWARMAEPEAHRTLKHYRMLLDLRKRRIAPLLQMNPYCSSRFLLLGECGLAVEWIMDGGTRLNLLANLGQGKIGDYITPKGDVLYSTGKFPEPWSVLWFLEKRE